MKKRTNLIIAAVGLGALMTVGGTLAWFTDSDEVTNMITIDSMNFTLTEPEWDKENGDKTPLVEPGATLAKDPTVTNVGDMAGYVQMIVDPGFTDENLNENVIKYVVYGENGQSNKVLDLEGLKNHWIKEGYEAKITEDNKLVIYMELESKGFFTVFDAVEFDGESMDNDYMNAELNIVVSFDAIQSDNNDVEAGQTIESKFANKNDDYFVPVEDPTVAPEAPEAQ